MKRSVSYQEEASVTDRRKALGRAFYELRRAERDEAHRKDHHSTPLTKDRVNKGK